MAKIVLGNFSLSLGLWAFEMLSVFKLNAKIVSGHCVIAPLASGATCAAGRLGLLD